MHALWITLSETGTGKGFGRFLVAVIVNRQQCERSDCGGRKSLEKTGGSCRRYTHEVAVEARGRSPVVRVASPNRTGFGLTAGSADGRRKIVPESFAGRRSRSLWSPSPRLVGSLKSNRTCLADGYVADTSEARAEGHALAVLTSSASKHSERSAERCPNDPCSGGRARARSCLW